MARRKRPTNLTASNDLEPNDLESVERDLTDPASTTSECIECESSDLDSNEQGLVEVIEETVEAPVEEPVKEPIEKPAKEYKGLPRSVDFALYENNMTPKLKVVIIISDNEDQVADANIARQLLRKDCISSSIHKIGDSKVDGVINTNEHLLAGSLKSACCALILDTELFKPVALRTWLTGRFTMSWLPLADAKYLDTWTNYPLLRLNYLSIKVREIKAKYNKDIIQDIKEAAFSLADDYVSKT